MVSRIRKEERGREYVREEEVDGRKIEMSV